MKNNNKMSNFQSRLESHIFLPINSGFRENEADARFYSGDLSWWGRRLQLVRKKQGLEEQKGLRERIRKCQVTKKNEIIIENKTPNKEEKWECLEMDTLFYPIFPSHKINFSLKHQLFISASLTVYRGCWSLFNLNQSTQSIKWWLLGFIYLCWSAKEQSSAIQPKEIRKQMRTLCCN